MSVAISTPLHQLSLNHLNSDQLSTNFTKNEKNYFSRRLLEKDFENQSLNNSKKSISNDHQSSSNL